MKASIRTKFTIGIVFFFVIICVLSIFSAFYLNRLSKKTSAILKENHISVIYARDMSEGLMNINQEITNCFLTNKNPNRLLINKELSLFNKTLQLEKNNLTEAGEDKLVAGIETGFIEYSDSVEKFIKSPKPVAKVLYLQKEFGNLYQQLLLLSQINGKAIELKTDDAKVSAKNALKQMTFLGTLCFLIALSFTYSFASYFNERFFQLYNGIKEIGSSNYGYRLYFDGKDEFYDISLVFNEMAEKLNENKQKMTVTLHVDSEKDNSFDDIQELKRFLVRIKSMEEQATTLITRFENKK
jgi:two-component system, NtrC family, sensor histidine kinase KinB